MFLEDAIPSVNSGQVVPEASRLRRVCGQLQGRLGRPPSADLSKIRLDEPLGGMHITTKLLYTENYIIPTDGHCWTSLGVGRLYRLVGTGTKYITGASSRLTPWP